MQISQNRAIVFDDHASPDAKVIVTHLRAFRLKDVTTNTNDRRCDKRSRPSRTCRQFFGCQGVQDSSVNLLLRQLSARRLKIVVDEQHRQTEQGPKGKPAQPLIQPAKPRSLKRQAAGAIRRVNHNRPLRIFLT